MIYLKKVILHMSLVIFKYLYIILIKNFGTLRSFIAKSLRWENIDVTSRIKNNIFIFLANFVRCTK